MNQQKQESGKAPDQVDIHAINTPPLKSLQDLTEQIGVIRHNWLSIQQAVHRAWIVNDGVLLVDPNEPTNLRASESVAKRVAAISQELAKLEKSLGRDIFDISERLALRTRGRSSRNRRDD
jgi:hypothetical protein